MKNQIKDLFVDALRQLSGSYSIGQKPRLGKIILTAYTIRKMAAYRIDGETLENAFRHGLEYRAGKIIHKYQRYSIGLYYKAQEATRQAEPPYVITTCWRGR